MPNPILYTQAMTVAALASAICVLALGWGWGVKHSRLNLVNVIGVACGLLAGYRVLHLRVAWPPVSALDRLLTIIIPTVIGIELLSGWNRVPRWLPWIFRVGLAVLTPRVLLHGSVYLSDTGVWPAWRSGILLIFSSVLLALMWWLTLAVARQPSKSAVGLGSAIELRESRERHATSSVPVVRQEPHPPTVSSEWGPPSGISVPLSVCLSIQCAAVTIMLAGYVTGGAAALPLTATLFGAVLASRLLMHGAEATGMIGIGVVGLFGLLFIGRFFGGLSTVQGLTILLAPMLCWITETRATRDLKAWQIGAVRLVLVAIPLIVIMVLEKQDFDRHTLPLLK